MRLHKIHESSQKVGGRRGVQGQGGKHWEEEAAPSVGGDRKLSGWRVVRGSWSRGLRNAAPGPGGSGDNSSVD